MYILLSLFSAFATAAQTTANKRSKEFRTHNIVSLGKIAQSTELYLSIWNSVCWPL